MNDDDERYLARLEADNERLHDELGRAEQALHDCECEPPSEALLAWARRAENERTEALYALQRVARWLEDGQDPPRYAAEIAREALDRIGKASEGAAPL